MMHTYTVKCPYCDARNQGQVEVASDKVKRLFTCDIARGGCGRDFALVFTFRYYVATYKIAQEAISYEPIQGVITQTEKGATP